MVYTDKNGARIKAGMIIQMADGSRERVYETANSDGSPDLGVSASNERYLDRHLEATREFYSLRNYNASELVIVEARE